MSKGSSILANILYIKMFCLNGIPCAEGVMAEWSKAAVLGTVLRAWVQIPLTSKFLFAFFFRFLNFENVELLFSCRLNKVSTCHRRQRVVRILRDLRFCLAYHERFHPLRRFQQLSQHREMINLHKMLNIILD